MKHILKARKHFGTILDTDGRTVLGKSVLVQPGSEVEYITIGAIDLVLVKHTDPSGNECYGWVFLEELDPVTDPSDQ